MHLRLTNVALALLATACILPLVSGPIGQVPVAHAQTSLPALPAGWPTTLQIGRSDGPGGAASMKAKAPFGFPWWISAARWAGRGHSP